jgi:hypothetical protein
MRGSFQDQNILTTVDVPREMTPQDLEELRCFIRNYDEINPGVDPTFVWERDKWREVTKYSAKQFSADPLSPTGQIIARNSRPDFVSQYLLRVHPANASWFTRFRRSASAHVGRLPLYKHIQRKLRATFTGRQR